ncbi:MAG: NADH-quinone oxidoreductase subunit NuoE [Candidatus Schekmanbacteria bacterium]|nr:NADH-quinone oxidoreductase subunit NuoE [Candidatus Schekmanbacteria bacterium]
MAKILSQKFYDEMTRLEPRYPTRVALLIPALHAAQDEVRWLPPEVLDEIAAYIGIHPAQVREVASFYTMFNLEPVGKYHLKVCTNVACCLRGAYQVVEHTEKKLGIKVGETTPDKRFTLHEEECLGACGTAPAMMLNDDYHENLTPERIDSILAGLE